MNFPSLINPIGFFLNSPFTALIDIGRTEAEDLSLDDGFRVKANPHASSGSYLEATKDSSSAGGVFDGTAGYYDLTVGYFDETDGVSHMEVVVNGTVVNAFGWDGDFGDAIITRAGRAEHDIQSIWLSPGDVIQIRGTRDGGEKLRTDYFDLEPSSSPPPTEPFVIEAENMDIISGFKIVTNSVGSGGAFLQDDYDRENGQPVEARAAYTVSQSGTYNVTVGYFDETDGISTLRVLLNGVEIDNFDWNSTSGHELANSDSRAERTIENVVLKIGDRIEIVGSGDGREPLRTDFLRFDPTEIGPQPTPDLWYEDNGEVVIALNDGTGAFTERGTGIAVGDADILSGDFDADGDIDFLRVISSGESMPSTGPDNFEFDISTTVFENDGAGNFTQGQASTFTVYHSYDGNSKFVFKAHDAKDVDGDGDVDFLATESAGGSSFLLQNDGTGNFTLLGRSSAVLGISNRALLADFDGNEALDAVFFTDSQENEVGIYTNNGSGLLAFSDVTSPSAESYGDGQILDLDGDGDEDVLFVASGESRGIYSFLNDGTGAAEGGRGPSFTSGEAGLIGSMEAGNFDLDSGIEMVSAGAEDDDEGIDPGLRVFDVVETADGKEFVLKSFDASIRGNVVANADFDLDGDVDLLIVPRSGPFEVTLLLNDGDAIFTSVGVVLPEFVTSEFSFAPALQVAFFDDGILQDEFILV